MRRRGRASYGYLMGTVGLLLVRQDLSLFSEPLVVHIFAMVLNDFLVFLLASNARAATGKNKTTLESSTPAATDGGR